MVRHFILLFLISSVTFAQDYAGAAVGAAIAYVIAVGIFFLCLATTIIVFIRVRKKWFRYLTIIPLSLCLVIDYKFKILGHFVHSLTPDPVYLLLPVENQKYFSIESTGDQHCGRGKLYYVDETKNIKTLIAVEEYDLDLSIPTQVYHLDSSVLVVPSNNFYSYYWSKDGRQFTKTTFRDPYFEGNQKIRIVLIKNGKMFILAFSQSGEKLFYITNANMVLEKLDKNEAEKWMNEAVSERPSACGPLLNKNWVNQIDDFINN